MPQGHEEQAERDRIEARRAHPEDRQDERDRCEDEKQPIDGQNALQRPFCVRYQTEHRHFPCYSYGHLIPSSRKRPVDLSGALSHVQDLFTAEQRIQQPLGASAASNARRASRNTSIEQSIEGIFTGRSKKAYSNNVLRIGLLLGELTRAPTAQEISLELLDVSISFDHASRVHDQEYKFLARA